jgi:hypothetical protein
MEEATQDLATLIRRMRERGELIPKEMSAPLFVREPPVRYAIAA